MKLRHLLVAPLVAGVAVLSACGDDSSGTTGTSGTTDTSTKVYLQVVKSVNASFGTDDDAVAAGKQACSDLESGTSMLTVVDNLSAKSGGTAQAAAVVGAAVSSFCPDQSDKVLPGN